MPSSTLPIALAAALALAAGAAPQAPPAEAPARQAADEAEPVAAAPGYRRPQTVEPGCVGRSVTIPEELQELAPAHAVVKFAVLRDGRVTRFGVMNEGVDPRIADVIRDGLASCAWTPGTDTKGAPVNVWVILTFRFRGE